MRFIIQPFLYIRTRRLLSRGKAGVSGAAKVVTMLESVPKVKEEPVKDIGKRLGSSTVQD